MTSHHQLVEILPQVEVGVDFPSPNAVMTQIWIPISVYVLIAIVRKKLRRTITTTQSYRFSASAFSSNPRFCRLSLKTHYNLMVTTSAISPVFRGAWNGSVT